MRGAAYTIRVLSHALVAGVCVGVILFLLVNPSWPESATPCATGNGHAAYGRGGEYLDPITASKRTKQCGVR